MLIIRCLCAIYWLLLTVLLLVPDPLALLGIHLIPGAHATVGAHFLVFAVLGVLVTASRLPLQPVLLAGLLIGYGIATELLQSLVPARDTTPWDLLENLLGLTAGAAIWWLVRKHLFQRPNGRG